MKLTIREVAELAGVSVTTVSQILNNKGSRFSKETREKVLEIVEKHQYKPDFFASNIITRHSKTIGMIVPDVTDFFFSKIIEGVETYLNSLGYMILLCNSKHSEEEETKYVSELLHRSVDGIILATPNILPEDHVLHRHLQSSFPVVLIDRGINTRDQGQLLIEEYEGACQAMESLIAKGHRHIGMLKESQGYYKLTERVTAYRDTLEKHEIAITEAYIQSGELTLKGGYQAAKEVLKNKEITAIFCGNDEMAIGAYQAVFEKGLRIPEDISIIGFDGLEISKYLTPTLTTVYQPAFDIGYFAAKFLVDAIHGEGEKMPNKIFEATFIERNSTKEIDNA
ncbi:substrate-binding domain-containing protein [Enterococcus sp. BWT-B8]|uniref:LacI family DNA-binding transcriptional regulator n=1 Tax=unclassified Enterococcus TaxID=2608891 RepID=UPI001E547D4B|nr:MULTISPECIES: substrate-binding domain-containing protein [unclassified Enterococcus]MCB5951339.1 substrate-binding domain-containing protein [Enterococcus sp. BWT-B8]MCB5954797.1 substrate-binding domain-containing protein [Enterococcus sp. CWB-B31]